MSGLKNFDIQKIILNIHIKLSGNKSRNIFQILCKIKFWKQLVYPKCLNPNILFTFESFLLFSISRLRLVADFEINRNLHRKCQKQSIAMLWCFISFQLLLLHHIIFIYLNNIICFITHFVTYSSSLSKRNSPR